MAAKTVSSIKLNELSNTLDRAINFFSPKWAASRLKARAQNNALSAVYPTYNKGASRIRRQTAYWGGGQSAPDIENEDSGERIALLQRSADLARNNPIARGAIDRQVINITGDTGLVPHTQIDYKGLGISKEEAKELGDTAEREWRIFSRRCDLSRTLTMRGIQEMVLRRAFIDGDVFVSTPYHVNPGDVYGTKLQVIESARVINPQYGPDLATRRAGVEYDAHGAPKAYHVLQHYPDQIYPQDKKLNQWERLQVFGRKSGLRRVCHVYLKERDGQSRGLPILGPIIEPLKQLDRYRDAELTAAVVAGMFTIFVTSDDPDAELESNIPDDYVGEILPDNSDQEFHIGDGAINYLRSNEDIKSTNPGRPNQAYEAFVMAIYKEISAGLSIPMEELLLYYQSSFSAARASIMQAWRLYKARRAWLADMLLSHVWQLFWWEAVAMNRLRVRGWNDPARRALYTECKWVGPARGAIQELQATKAAKIRKDEGFSTTAQEAIEMNGSDAERNIARLGDENRQRIAEDLQPIGTKSTVQ